MKRSLRSKEVIDMISKKISLKREIRAAKEVNDLKTVESLTEKLSTVENKLQSRPLQKT